MQIISASGAAALIQDDWTVITGGFGSCGHPEAVTIALAERFERKGEPLGLTLLFAAGQGDRANRGLNRLARPGLVRRAIGGYWGLVPELGRMAIAGQIQAHNWPQGVICSLFRAIAAGQPGVISRVGLHTFIDPRRTGGRLGATSEPALVSRLELDGHDFLFYPGRRIDCAVIRGSTADENGNITMEREATFQDSLAQAQAARNCGGIVIAQVQTVVPAGTLIPQQVKVPGILVDYVVLAEGENHAQTYAEQFNPDYTVPGPARHLRLAAPLGARRVVCRRAMAELAGHRRPVVNLGIGIPAEIGALAALDAETDFTLTVESGPVGGMPAAGLSFGASARPQAVIDQGAQFDFYDGGGIDFAFLGFGEVDARGNVNVSHFNGRLFGVGGFVNISQAAKTVAFCGTFTSGGLDVRADSGRLDIQREGSITKFVPEVQHLSFNGAYAAAKGQAVLYITERAVFRLVGERLTVVEIAPGVDLEADILRRTGIPLAVAPDCRTMDRSLFTAASLPNAA